MDEIVQELIDKTEKLDCKSENLKYSTNWCDLPVEMRLECIKEMDLITRARLRATSHTEKSLVDCKKFHFDSVYLMYCNCHRPFGRSYRVLTIDAITHKRFGSGYIHLQTINDHEKMRNCAVQILKNCEIDTFKFSELDKPGELQDFWAVIERCAPFRFKTFKSRSDSPEQALFFLKNCEGVETIQLNNKTNRNFKISDFVDLPVVINAKIIQFDRLHESDEGFHQLVQKWIDSHSEIGKSIRIATNFARISDSFASKFESRVIYKKDNEVRIRTDDKSKHILMSCKQKPYSQYIDSYYSCTIISSNLLESEYNEDREWISNTFYEELYVNDEHHYRSEYEEEEDYALANYDIYGGRTLSDLIPYIWW